MHRQRMLTKQGPRFIEGLHSKVQLRRDVRYILNGKIVTAQINKKLIWPWPRQLSAQHRYTRSWQSRTYSAMMSDQAKRSFKEPTRILGGVPHVISLPDWSEAMNSNVVKKTVLPFRAFEKLSCHLWEYNKGSKDKGRTNQLSSIVWVETRVFRVEHSNLVSLLGRRLVRSSARSVVGLTCLVGL